MSEDANEPVQAQPSPPPATPIQPDEQALLYDLRGSEKPEIRSKIQDSK